MRVFIAFVIAAVALGYVAKSTAFSSSGCGLASLSPSRWW
jgi:hypothetical protein